MVKINQNIEYSSFFIKFVNENIIPGQMKNQIFTVCFFFAAIISFSSCSASDSLPASSSGDDYYQTETARTASMVTPVMDKNSKKKLEQQRMVLYSTITVSLSERKKPGILGYIGIGVYHAIKWLFVRN